MSEVNHVLVLSYNGLPLLKRCIASVRQQDIQTSLFVVDNHSTDGAAEWLLESGVNGLWDQKNRGVSAGWNHGLRIMFDHEGADHVLVLNQDVVIGNSFYLDLLAFDVPLVTGFPTEDMGKLDYREEGLEPHPCFSAYLIRKSCWRAVGEFNTEMFGWASDCDYHVRAHRLGIGFWKAKVPFFHLAGSTMRNAGAAEKAWFFDRANKDRAVFRRIYGCEPGEPGYAELFK